MSGLCSTISKASESEVGASEWLNMIMIGVVLEAVLPFGSMAVTRGAAGETHRWSTGTVAGFSGTADEPPELPSQSPLSAQAGLSQEGSVSAAHRAAASTAGSRTR